MSTRSVPALVLLAALLAPSAARAQSAAPTSQAELRVEPGFWWTGMVHDELQVMLHGPDVGHARVAMVPYPGVTLDRVTAVDSPNYLFLHLTVGDAAAPGMLSFTLDGPGGVRPLAYELRPRTRAPGSYAQGFSSEDVIYLMMPDRFANGDPSNDTVPGMREAADRQNPNGRHGGDFAGVRDRLGYLDDLGMTAVWFTPTFENDMTPEYGAYHGYAATDLYATDPRFGTTEEYVALVEAAHGRGMKVIMDMIHNHVGDQHWWMGDLPTPDWVHDWDEVGQTNFTGHAVVDPYASEADRRQAVDGWFVREMPDLNQENPLLAQYLLQNTVWWIEHAGIDGIRMDTYYYADKDYMARWAAHVLNEYPDFNIVGEAWMFSVPHEAYWQDGFRGYHDGYDSNLPSVTDFQLAYAMREAPDGGLFKVYEVLSQDFAYPDPNGLVTFFDNHDLDRAYGSDLDALRLGLTLQLTTRGIPQVYYGTEIAMPNGERTGGDGYKRMDMPGGWPGDPRDAFTPAGRTATEQAAFEFTRALATWRKTADVVHHGRLTQFIPRDDVYVYFRWDDDDTVMVVLSATDEPRTLDLARFAERIGGHTSGRDVVTGETVRLGSSMEVPGRAAMVLELE